MDASGLSDGKANSTPVNCSNETVQRVSEGDRVRIDIPDETDFDHQQYHGIHGTVVKTFEDDADIVVDDDRQDVIYRIELDTGEIADFRWRDIRSPIE